MSLEIARQVNAEFPAYLQTNVGESCHWFTIKLIERLRAAGHRAFHVCKTLGEGQYVPHGFQPRTVIGLDGKPYVCTGVSHDAIWCDDKIVDTIASANDGEEPIFNGNGTRLTGTPVWNEVDPQFWRPNNPPLRDAPVVSPPLPPPQVCPHRILPKGEAFMLLKALNAFYAAPEGLQRPGGLVLTDLEGRSVADMEAIAQWFYQLAIEGVSLADVFTQIRASEEWRSKHP